jgi:hypothetical protein
VFQDDVIEEIGEEYIKYMTNLPAETCVDDMVNVDVFFRNKIKANPDYRKAMEISLKESLKKIKLPLKESDDEEFMKLLDLANQGDGNEMQAWEMHEYFDLTDEQIEQLRNIVTKEIIYNAEEPGKKLIEVGYDFHKDFTEVYGVTPPRDQKFVFNKGDTRLAVELPGKRKLIFTFWFGADNVDYPSDPWIFMLNDEGEYVTIQTPQAGEIEMSIATDGAYAGETSGQISKKDVPIQIKKHTGWTESGGINEKIDRNYLYRMINEVLHEEEDDDFLQKLFNLVSTGEVEQAFDLADSLDMDKELLQRIVNDEGNNDLNHGLTFAISDKGTVAMVEYAVTRPELGDKIKWWLNDDKVGLPFTKLGKFNKYTGTYDGPIDLEMYRKVALLVFQSILEKYDQFNDLNEENFGRESRGDEVLEEGWEDQWPNQLNKISSLIQSNVSEPFQESIAKIFFRTANVSDLMPVRFVRAMSNHVKISSEKSMKFYSNKIKTYNKYISDIQNAPSIDFPEEDKKEQIAEFEEKIKKEKEILAKYESFYKLGDDPFYFGRARRKEVLQQGRAIGSANPNSNLPSMRYINKTIKSLKKQLTKWREKNTDGFPNVNVAVGDTLRHLDVMISDLSSRVFNKFENDFRWLFLSLKSVRGTGEDTAKKLSSILKKNKDLPMDQFIEEIKKFSLQNNKDYFNNCDDVPDGDPCVFLRLDNGMFWHSTASEYCEITQVEMNNCGSASQSGSILYNLMSINEGGSVNYHVTLEYNKDKNQVIQVLGQANTLPKEKYWSSITEFFNAMGNPQLNKDAFQHLYSDEQDTKELDAQIDAFIRGIGASTKPKAAFRTWEAMKEQIRSGYYSELIETVAPINNRTNAFRVSLSYAGMTGPVDRPNAVATVVLNFQVVLQTKEEDKVEEWRKSNPDIFRKAREFGESQEFKQLLYNAIPERLTRANRLDIKYSNIVNARLRLGAAGNYKMRIRFPFQIPVRSWNESKGELLSMRFEQLLERTLRDLPAQAMLVFMAVENKLNENKKKLDKQYLFSMISEVLQENENSADKFLQKLKLIMANLGAQSSYDQLKNFIDKLKDENPSGFEYILDLFLQDDPEFLIQGYELLSSLGLEVEDESSLTQAFNILSMAGSDQDMYFETLRVNKDLEKTADSMGYRVASDSKNNIVITNKKMPHLSLRINKERSDDDLRKIKPSMNNDKKVFYEFPFWFNRQIVYIKPLTYSAKKDIQNIAMVLRELNETTKISLEDQELLSTDNDLFQIVGTNSIVDFLEKAKYNKMNLLGKIKTKIGLSENEGFDNDMLLQLDDPDFVKQGVELLATSQGMFIDDMWHNKLENESDKDSNWRELMFKLIDEYVFIMESRKDAEMLAEMLKDFYESKGMWDETGSKRVTSIVADSHNYGDHRVMMDVDK